MSDLEDITRQLAAVALAAGALLREMQGSARALGGRLKGPAQLVTEADTASHVLIHGELCRRFPGVPLVLEEQDNPPLLPDRYLVGDELDGTAIYAHGYAEWGVTLALVENGRPAAGVLHQPLQGITVTAWRGGGAWLGDGAWLGARRLALDPAVSLSGSIILAEFNRFLDSGEVAWVDRLAFRALTLRALGTAVGGAVELLAGHASLYLNCRGAKVWDFAAAVVAVEEAGGLALALDGGALDWSVVPQGVLLAANASVAAEALGLRKAAGQRL